MGITGSVIGCGVGLVTKAVCEVIGSEVGKTIARGMETIAKPVIDGATEIVKKGTEAVKNVAKGAWEGVKPFVSSATSFVNSIASFFGF